MNTITANNASTESRGTFARFLRTLRTELRRALELVGEPYKNGMMPPL
jgi:hypothetical protein